MTDTAVRVETMYSGDQVCVVPLNEQKVALGIRVQDGTPYVEVYLDREALVALVKVLIPYV